MRVRGGGERGNERRARKREGRNQRERERERDATRERFTTGGKERERQC